MTAFLNFILFQVAWLACVLGGAHDFPWVGPLVAAAVAAYHLAQVPNAASELTLLLAAAAIGAVFDTSLVATGWLAYPSGQWHPLLAPYWIIALWVAFATTLNVSLSWLRGHPWWAILFGSVGGPMAYYAGAKLGGVTFNDQTLALAALSIGWATITPILVSIAGRLAGWRPDGKHRLLTTAAE